MAVNVSPFGPKPQFVDAAGKPLVGGKLFAYVAGSTSTKQDTFTNSTGGVANANPVILNALGEPPDEYWFTDGLLYKIVLAPATDTDPPTNPIWSIDNLEGQNSTPSTTNADEWILFSSAPTYVNATTFTVVGNQTQIFQPKRRVRSTNTGGTTYSTIVSSVYGALTTVTVANSLGVLDSGLSAVYYGILSSVNPSSPGISSARLVGRTSAGIGPAEEISVGNGLTFAAGTLSSSGVLLGTTYYTCPIQNVTISNGSPAVITSPTAGVRPQNGSPVVFTSSGVLPLPLVIGTTYWVIGATGSTINVALTKGGAAINTTTAGSGTHTMGNAAYTKATLNPSFIIAEAMGAGGGSGGASIAGYVTGGAGAGANALSMIASSLIGASEIVTTGAGGTAGANTGTAGGTGGTSSFGTFVVCTGGIGSTGSTSGVSQLGALGGTATGGDINLTGTPGFPAQFITNASTPGTGGVGRFGGAVRSPNIIATVVAGQNALNNTGAGATGCNAQATTAQTGGIGGSGIVIITEYS